MKIQTTASAWMLAVHGVGANISTPDVSFEMHLRNLVQESSLMNAADEFGGTPMRSLVASHIQGRGLQNESYNTIDHDKLRCFYKCVEDKMTTEQCIEYIKETIGEDLQEHQISKLEIKVSEPRPLDLLSKTFWMIGIPTTITGEVDCNLNDGQIVYPWTWEVFTDGPDSAPTLYAIPSVDCNGLEADACCDKIMSEYVAQGVPLEDGLGNCLSCWVHQEPLEPLLAEGEPSRGGAVDFVEHSFLGGSCIANELPESEVATADTEAKSRINIVRPQVMNLIQSGEDAEVSCSEMKSLFNSLLLAGRSFPRAMLKIPSLLCGECNDLIDGTFILTREVIRKLQWIHDELLVDELDSVRECIIIYEDRQGLVLEPPKIGGSRTDMDYDRDDPDCNTPEPNPGLDCSSPLVPSEDGESCVCDPLMYSNPMELDASCLCQVDGSEPTIPPNAEPGTLLSCGPSGNDFACPPQQEATGVGGECKCISPLVGDGQGGCKDCLAPQFYVDGACACPDGSSAAGDACVCDAPFVDDGSGACKACISPQTYEGGVCVCSGGAMAQGKDCICPAPLVSNGGNGCKECPPSQVYKDGACACEGGAVANGDTCACPKPLIKNSQSGKCEACKAPLMYVDGSCACPAPLVAEGNVAAGESLCICPAGQVAISGGGCGPLGGPVDPCPSGLKLDQASGKCWNDCGCGYCAPIKASKGGNSLTETSCCVMNGGGNNCVPPNNIENDQCGRSKFIVTFNTGDNGNVCSGVEISETSAQRGCGCQPSRTRPCDFDPTLPADTCRHCSLINLNTPDPECSGCANCLKQNCRSTRCNAGNFEACLADDANAVRRALRGLQKGKPSAGGGPIKGDATETGTGSKQAKCADVCASACERGAVYPTTT